MQAKQINNIVIVGSGKAAHFFSTLFYENEVNVLKIIGRNEKAIKTLAEEIQAEYNTQFIIPHKADLVILAISDNAIEEVANKLNIPADCIICHCAGSVSVESLKSFKNAGVIYPLQTLVNATASNTPFLIVGNNEQTTQSIYNLISRCKLKVQVVSDEDRMKYHLTAVFVNNFTNAQLVIAKNYCQQTGLDFNLLIPLLHQTIQNITNTEKPETIQTGPARRGDISTIQQHRNLLQNDTEILNLYNSITNYLLKKYENERK